MDQMSRLAAEPAGRYREDLEANLRLVEALAPIHCTDCHGYHLSRARRRLRPGSPDALDRLEIVQLVQDCVAHRPVPGGFHILIAGTGDTNLLATCAEAVSGGETDADRAIRYTILDNCRTPLAVCEAFAQAHRLELQTRQVDMGAPDAAFAADLIVVHSLLRFLPRASHLTTMRTLRQWLKPGGAVVFSHRLMADEAGKTDSFYRSEYPSVASILALLSVAGFRVASMQEHVEDPAAAAGREPRHRLLALLRAV